MVSCRFVTQGGKSLKLKSSGAGIITNITLPVAVSTCLFATAISTLQNDDMIPHITTLTSTYLGVSLDQVLNSSFISDVYFLAVWNIL